MKTTPNTECFEFYQISSRIIKQIEQIPIPYVQTKYTVILIERRIEQLVHIDVNTNEIEVSLPYLEYLWSAAQVHYLLYVGTLDLYRKSENWTYGELRQVRPHLNTRREFP